VDETCIKRYDDVDEEAGIDAVIHDSHQATLQELWAKSEFQG
jgi:hypothetical protein